MNSPGMKKIFITCLLGLMCCTYSYSQSSSLQFLYITKDYNTLVNPLIEEIEDVYNFVTGDSSRAAIFYLADWDTPIIVRVNLPGDNRRDMDRLYSALVTKSEVSSYPLYDLEIIPALFERYPLRSESGAKTFSDVELRYYVSPTFWNLSYNEQVIASLWFIMDFDQPWSKDYVDMSIFHQDGDGLKPDWDHPFGPKDLCSNYKFQLMTY